MDLKAELANHIKYWQYERGTRASDERLNNGSIGISLLLDHGAEARVCSLLIDGSLQWEEGGNDYRKCNIIDLISDYFRLPLCTSSDINDRAGLLQHNMQHYAGAGRLFHHGI